MSSVYQLLKLAGGPTEPEQVLEVLDEGDDFDRLKAVELSLQAQSLDAGKTLSQERYAVRNAPCGCHMCVERRARPY